MYCTLKKKKKKDGGRQHRSVDKRCTRMSAGQAFHRVPKRDPAKAKHVTPAMASRIHDPTSTLPCHGITFPSQLTVYPQISLHESKPLNETPLHPPSFHTRKPWTPGTMRRQQLRPKTKATLMSPVLLRHHPTRPEKDTCVSINKSRHYPPPPKKKKTIIIVIA